MPLAGLYGPITMESLQYVLGLQKAAELENYLPEQYQVVQQAQLSREGNCVVLLISPLAKELAKLLK